MNLLTITQTFKTEDNALDYLIEQRWPNGGRCLACDHDKVYRIDTLGKTGKHCRLFECAECGLHFSATTGTLFHDSHLPLQKWFMAMALMAEAKKGISANQVSRHIGVTYKTAWYLCHRIRKAMEETTEPLGSRGQIVEIDESFIGGKTRRKGLKAAMSNKVAVLGIAERKGRVHLESIPDTKAVSIRPVLEAKLSPNASEVITDAAVVYAHLIPTEKHTEIVHQEELARKGFVSNRTIEGAFSLFKRGIVGSYHSLGRGHMDAYLQEFCWRYNRRGQQSEMFTNLLRETVSKKPMPFKALVKTS